MILKLCKKIRFDYDNLMEDSVQKILLKEFQYRTNKNALYSLRAFARDLNLLPSHLSSLLKRKAGLSKAKTTKIADILNFSIEQKKYFINLTESQFGRNEFQRLRALNQLKKIQTRYKNNEMIDTDLFNIIANWQHLAILELCYIKNFRSTPQWIAESLGLTIA